MTDIPRTANVTKKKIFEATDAIRNRGNNVTQQAVDTNVAIADHIRL